MKKDDFQIENSVPHSEGFIILDGTCIIKELK